MGLDSFNHGVRVFELNDGTRPIRTIETAVVGLLAYADDADSSVFPLNTPALVTNIQTAIGKAGDKGTLVRSLDAIVDQANTAVVVVRIPKGADEAELTSNAIGTTLADGKYTGMKALLGSKQRFGVKPRILIAPGIDNQAVTSEMLGLAKKTRSMVYAAAHDCPTKEDAVLYRKNFGSRELMLIWPDFEYWDTSLNTTQAGYATARAAGLRAQIDNDIGWHKTISNVQVAGVTGINKDVFWDLQDPNTDSGYLNSHEITTLINSNGYRFWGNRTCSDDPLFCFENYTRTAHILADTMAEAQQWANDKPMSVGLMRDIIDGLNAKFRELKQYGYLIDGNAWFDPSVNTKEVLKNGGSYIDYDYTSPPPLENLMLRQRITDRYLIKFANSIAK